jgi:hypothetical protein
MGGDLKRPAEQRDEVVPLANRIARVANRKLSKLMCPRVIQRFWQFLNVCFARIKLQLERREDALKLRQNPFGGGQR